eukprot:1156645-Pelagomonas_calceolata.AAC.1
MARLVEDPTYPHTGKQEELFVPNQSSPTLMLEVPDWRTWAYTDGSCRFQPGILRMSNKKLEQASTAHSQTAKYLLCLTVLELPTPYAELNQQQVLLPSHTVKHTLPQTVSLFSSWGLPDKPCCRSHGGGQLAGVNFCACSSSWFVWWGPAFQNKVYKVLQIKPSVKKCDC